MTYERFEDLPVWQAALDLARKIYAHTRDRFYSQPGTEYLERLYGLLAGLRARLKRT